MVGLTGFTLNGLDLRTLATNIDSANGWDSWPGLKAVGADYAYSHGEDFSGRLFYRARDIDLAMVILATNSSGVVITSPQQHVDANIATLLGALHSTSSPLSLVRTLASAETRTALVRPIDFARVEDHVGPTRRVNLTLRMGYPFWHGAAFDVTNSGSFSFNNLGNAPINDFELTFNGAGRLTHSASGDWVESSAAGVTINIGTGVVTAGSSAAVNSNRPWLIQLEPGNNSLSATASVTLEGFYGYI